MNHRQRFLATMHYQPRDRVPICDFSFWEETIVLWRDQGLPEDIVAPDYYLWRDGNADLYFGMGYSMDRAINATGLRTGLWPEWEERVIEDRGDHEVFQQSDGVQCCAASS